MHRTDDQKDGGNRLAGLSPAVSGPPGPTVIPFPQDRSPPVLQRREPTPHRLPPPVPLGIAVAAVVMKLQSARPRIKVLSQTTREEEK
ncbi:hypothetical protein BJ928_104137 [Rhizobium sp. WW_1]|jgi:hypothetical protein|nr:hypothetical protein BJ928_104137 [Rhizobium sp. WW_1]